MNMVEMIEQLSNDTITVDDNFKKLKDALDEYHHLIHEGKLIPRGNTIQNMYITYFTNSNANG